MHIHTHTHNKRPLFVCLFVYLLMYWLVGINIHNDTCIHLYFDVNGGIEPHSYPWKSPQSSSSSSIAFSLSLLLPLLVVCSCDKL